MTEDLKEMSMLMAEHAAELKKSLLAIDGLLGSPRAAEFTEATITTLVDDVLRLSMMLKDILAFLDRVIANEIDEIVWEEIAHYLKQSKDQV